MKLFTEHLYDALATHPCISREAFGVFASDQVPYYLPPKSYVIVNLDPISQSGSHWVAIYKDSADRLEFFDSYGQSPLRYNTISHLFRSSAYAFNTKVLQSTQSDVCGQFCLFFLIHRCRGYSLPDIVEDLFVLDPVRNDGIVDMFYKTTIAPRVERIHNAIRRRHKPPAPIPVPRRLQQRPCLDNYPCGFQGCHSRGPTYLLRSIFKRFIRIQ